MRGRQLSYYVTPQDWASLLDQLAGRLDFDIYRRIFHGSISNAMMTLGELKTSEELFFCLTNASNKSLLVNPFGTAVGKSNEFIISEGESEVIGAGRSYIGIECGHRVMRPARMYYSPTLSVGVNKSPQFLVFADKVLQHTRAHLRRVSGSYYYGPEALALTEDGKVKMV
jgi:hypothetical protein